MHMKTRPTDIIEKQAISAIGQCRLVRLWEDIFAIREQKVAQLLLTRNDLIDRPRFVNFRNTLLQLLAMNVIPIINENDALATEGLKFGDNDTLGAYVAISIGATWFYMLTDVDCLYTSNPRYHEDAAPIAYVAKINAIYSLLDTNESEPPIDQVKIDMPQTKAQNGDLEGCELKSLLQSSVAPRASTADFVMAHILSECARIKRSLVF